MYFTSGLRRNRGGSRHEAQFQDERVIFLIRHIYNCYILHRNALAAWAACPDPRFESHG